MAPTTNGNPVSDLMYDWLTVLHSKAEGLNAYQQYIQDAQKENATECVRLLKKLQDQDTAMVKEVKDHVTKMLAKK